MFYTVPGPGASVNWGFVLDITRTLVFNHPMLSGTATRRFPDAPAQAGATSSMWSASAEDARISAEFREIESTEGLCPSCLARVPAEIGIWAGSIYLRKRCPTHGTQWALREKYAAFYLRRTRFDKPGTTFIPQTQIGRGCPFDCGLCPAHGQHTCIGLIEITPHCDLACPDCYAKPGSAGLLSMATVEKMLDFYQEAEHGKAEIVQISGGEPASHPDILEILRLAKAKRFKYVMLNTNGSRLAQDREFARELGALAGNFEVYLQFDGFDRQAVARLRGADLLDVKLRALDRLREFAIPATLVMTVKAGVNEAEVGKVIECGLRNPSVRGVNFQPTAYYGAEPPPPNRMTLTGVLEAIETHTGGRLRMDDFVPLPCNVERAALTFLQGGRGGFSPITRDRDFQPYLPHIPNTLAFDPADFPGLCGPASSGSGGCECFSSLVKLLRPLIPKRYGAGTEAAQIAHVSQNTFRISVTSFIDAYDFELSSMRKECVHIITPDLRRIPFSAYNLYHRRR